MSDAGVAPCVVSVIGAGRIGREVVAFLRDAEGLRLGRVLSRRGIPDTSDASEFFATPADLVIEAAGPEALRAYGAEALLRGDLWAVGAGALADDGFREKLERVARAAGTRLRLFSPWIAGIGHGNGQAGGRLRLRAMRPGLGAGFSGPLREAVRLYPVDLNSAVAAALCGPGLDATWVDLREAGPDGPHAIEADHETPFGRFTTRAEFGAPGDGAHPTAAALIGALRREVQVIRYG